MPKILSIATAVPPNSYTQKEIQDSCRDYFGPIMLKNGHAAVFDRAGVKTRYLVEPKEYYFTDASFESRNRNYFKHALSLATACIHQCLEECGISFDEITHIFNVTTTGLL